MFTGGMIDELIGTVEKAEIEARTVAMQPAPPAPRHTTYPVLSPYMYEFAILDQAVIGVA
jgi:hypothetical protein